ncbi:MAG: electron transfer flavoprotein-ubiquinone oxidoreductase [Proteobacteria bacterium]|nr:electron transfer flavoprotein-ubiquinone oxidoreductase [Pseudomonadota bacterium]
METTRDIMEYDVAIVGAGPAGLACAIRLKQLKPELDVCILEKGSEPGAHLLSGAILEPAALDELLPEWRQEVTTTCVAATQDRFVMLTKKHRIPMPLPPQMNNHGNYILSLNQLGAWLAGKAEALGIDVFPGFAGNELLYDQDERVTGVRVGDMGLQADGSEGPNFAAGVDIHCRLTVLAEGCHGSLAKRLIAKFSLNRDCDPQTYGLGFKELWQLPKGRGKKGHILHSVGWPLDGDIYGGSFVYHLDMDRVYVGFVIGLDYSDPEFEPFEAFQQFKHHPMMRKLLAGAELVSAGSRTIIEGGWQSMPRLETPGAMLVGDAGGMLNVPKIKGIHMALRSGMLAAQHFVERGDSHGFDARFRHSPTGLELKKVRNIRPGFRYGFWAGLANAALETVTAGRLPYTLRNHSDHDTLRLLDENKSPNRHWVDRELPPRDRLASVYFSATDHDEDQPVHLHVADTDICVTRCAVEFGNPCTRFCPVGVYEIVRDDAGSRLQINAANCVHCKACDIKDPYGIIEWVPPEGGSGPNYRGL